LLYYYHESGSVFYAKVSKPRQNSTKPADSRRRVSRSQDAFPCRPMEFDLCRSRFQIHDGAVMGMNRRLRKQVRLTG